MRMHVVVIGMFMPGPGRKCRTIVDHAAVSKYDRALDQILQLTQFMQHGKDGRPLSLEGAQCVRKRSSGLTVNPREWFIQDEEIRIAYQRAGDQYALLLPAGKQVHALPATVG